MLFWDPEHAGLEGCGAWGGGQEAPKSTGGVLAGMLAAELTGYSSEWQDVIQPCLHIRTLMEQPQKGPAPQSCSWVLGWCLDELYKVCSECLHPQNFTQGVSILG